MKFIKTLKCLTTVLPATLLLISCGNSTNSGGGNVTADVGFVDPQSLPTTTGKISAIRLRSLQETATSLGATGALAWRATHINESLKQQTDSLDQTYDFNQLLLHHNVLPPVIEEATNDVNLDSNDTIRLTNKVYKIARAARFVTVPPTWRDYLWLNFKKPDLPDESLLPTNAAEADVWNSYLQQGWKQGLAQAESIFRANVSLLKRDYTGMVLYRKLLAQKMVSPPTVAKAQMGITGNTKEMRVNDVVMRITSHSSLQTNAQQWQPFLTKDK